MKNLIKKLLNTEYRILITLLFILFLFVSVAKGITNYVSQAGLHVSPYSTWDNAAKDIQSAVDAAVPGNVILVTNGTYNLTAKIEIATNLIVKSVNGSDVTIVDGGNAVSCFVLNGGSVVIDGFTIRNGNSTTFGGGIGSMALHANILNCTVSDNTTPTGYGGGILCYFGGFVSNCIINDNSSLIGGGIVFFYSGDMYDCIISNNIATGDPNSSGGGAALLFGGSIKNSVICNNISVYAGGGVVLAKSGLIENCVIKRNNILVGRGGGAFISDNAIIIKSSVSENRANFGGGVYCVDGSTVRDCFVNGGNSATEDGGGVYCGKYAKVMNSVITGNSAGKGGGVYSATGFVENCTIADNSATGNGEGLYCNNGSNINNIIYFNTALAGENIHNAGNIFYSYCCSMPAMTGEGNIADDPEFADRALGDFQLFIGSPCIETGTLLPWMLGTKDIVGNDRISGHFVDMGPYEFPIFRAKTAEWIFKSKKNKGIVKGKFISPSFTNYFNDGWMIGLKNGETGELIDGPRELVPNKKNKVWKFKEKKKAVIKYKAKKDILVYKVWTAIPPTNIIFLVQTNAPGVNFSSEKKEQRNEIEFFLLPDSAEKNDGWKRLIHKSGK